MNAREMVSVGIRRHGGPEALEVLTGPVPKPGPGEVLVRNHWIGVNYVDLQHRAGRPYPVTLPLVPGTEAAGVVEAVGMHFTSPSLKPLLSYTVFIAVLLLRPNGLFHRKR